MLLTVSTVKLLQEGLFRGYVDLIARRRAKRPVPNDFLREAQELLNPNVTFEGLDADLKRDISAASSVMLAYFNKLGYKLVPKDD